MPQRFTEMRGGTGAQATPGVGQLVTGQSSSVQHEAAGMHRVPPQRRCPLGHPHCAPGIGHAKPIGQSVLEQHVLEGMHCPMQSRVPRAHRLVPLQNEPAPGHTPSTQSAVVQHAPAAMHRSTHQRSPTMHPCESAQSPPTEGH